MLLYLCKLANTYLEDVVVIYFLYTSLATGSMKKEAMNVYNKLKGNDPAMYRKALARIVGRDTGDLGRKEVIRAAVETTAENTVDGVLAPFLYILLGMCFGIPVQMVFLYKVVNTLDSMVGYIQEPYTEIGFASAKADDILNFIPARLGSILMVLGGGMLGFSAKNGFKILKRDGNKHRSPNSGHPEAAVAGLLGVRIGGTNKYFGQVLEKPRIGDSLKELDERDIISSIKIMYVSELLLWAIGVLVILAWKVLVNV